MLPRSSRSTWEPTPSWYWPSRPSRSPWQTLWSKICNIKVVHLCNWWWYLKDYQLHQDQHWSQHWPDLGHPGLLEAPERPFGVLFVYENNSAHWYWYPCGVQLTKINMRGSNSLWKAHTFEYHFKIKECSQILLQIVSQGPPHGQDGQDQASTVSHVDLDDLDNI